MQRRLDVTDVPIEMDDYKLSVKNFLDWSFDKWKNSTKFEPMYALDDMSRSYIQNYLVRYLSTKDEQVYHDKSMRYSNIYTTKDNTVKLESKEDYPKYLDVTKFTPNFLQGSAPVPDIIPDWWEMVMQENVRLIVMTTPWVENKIIKADKYFPLDDKLFELSNGVNIRVSKIIYNNEKDGITVRELKIKKKDKTYTLFHIHYFEWTDMSCLSIDGFGILLQLIFQLFNRVLDKHKDAKILNHCSAGVGRSGTLASILYGIHHINHMVRKGTFDNNSLINIVFYVDQLRQKRSNIVQLFSQLQFVYQYLKIYTNVVMKGQIVKKTIIPFDLDIGFDVFS